MGRVLLAWDPVLGRRLALKVLHGSDPAQTVRLLREAQAQARLRHPGICRVLDAATDPAAGDSFIAMELVEGPPLHQLRAQLGPRDLAQLMAEVCDAIASAHVLGLVHRDLKPANILVEPLPQGSWRPVVVDFGLARELALDDQTLSWALAGTPSFMSPQQGRGEPASPQDDVYALGATLHAMLTGVPPYEAVTLAGLLTLQASQDPAPLRSRFPGVPRDLETITLKAVEPEAHRRYASVEALGEDLRRFLNREAPMATPIHGLERLWRRVLRRKRLSAALLAGGLLVGGLVTWNLVAARQARIRVELAQRFGLEVGEIENLLRVERMLPPHDMRPLEMRVRWRLDQLARMVQELGAVAEGPGFCALGKGYLALREPARALPLLERSWGAGYRTQELSEALGLAHAECFTIARLQAVMNKEGDWETALEAARQRHLAPALQALAEAGQGSASSLAQAHLALLQQDWATAARRCEALVQQNPWHHEALVLQAQALVWGCTQQGFQEGAEGRLLRPTLQQADQLLVRAQALAPSDLRVHQARLELLGALAVIESEEGHPTAEPFRQADLTFQAALALAPSHPELWSARLGVRHREAFFRLARGEDVRPFLRETLRLVEQGERACPEGSRIREQRETPLWLLAEAQWRRGEDPTAALAEGLTLVQHSMNVPEMRIVEARYRIQRGLDPMPGFAAGEEALERLSRREPGNFYYATVWGELLTVRAHWELDRGLDPWPTLRRGLQQLETAISLKPTTAYAYFHLPWLRALEARLCIREGRDPEPALRAALEVGRRGVSIRPDHFRAQLALAEALLARAEWEQHRARPGAPALQEAQAALETARRHNPTDWRIAWSLARLEQLRGNPAGAKRHALAGLAVKGDATELRRLLAALPQDSTRP